ncbi:MAG TPA: type II toxin-antitoxin system RelE/ParE family toxin [Tepidisphaeraceae bacterium]|nr:type II toxin-antitoxin system RelE/ParE family toxin [Tepidisphaeraceae bacterium]
MKRIIVEPEAEADIAAACAWYDEQQPGLSIRFIERIEAAFALAAERPHTFPFVHRLTQRVLVRQFPYLILFQDLPDSILIIGVFHAARDPISIRSRAE